MSEVKEPCECGWLGSSLNDPEVPVCYDPEANRFYFTGPNQAQLMLRYCPFCGGKLPDSNFQMEVPIAPVDEYPRLEQLVRGIKTPATAIETLGTPDYDAEMKTYRNDRGTMVVDRSQPTIRNIEYYGLSDWFTIEFYFGERSVESRIVAKCLNARQLEVIFERPGN